MALIQHNMRRLQHLELTGAEAQDFDLTDALTGLSALNLSNNELTCLPGSMSLLTALVKCSIRCQGAESGHGLGFP